MKDSNETKNNYRRNDRNKCVLNLIRLIAIEIFSSHKLIIVRYEKKKKKRNVIYQMILNN